MEKKKKFRWINIDGIKYRTKITEGYKNRQHYEPPDDKKLFSAIPGTVLKVLVKPGQKVKMGQSVLILEAMKMKNYIKIETGGVIKQIKVKQGDKISKNHLLLELE